MPFRPILCSILQNVGDTTNPINEVFVIKSASRLISVHYSSSRGIVIFSFLTLLHVGYSGLWVRVKSPTEATTEALQPTNTGCRDTNTGNSCTVIMWLSLQCESKIPPPEDI